MMEDHSFVFRQKLPGQAETCARKTLEWLQKDIQGDRTLCAKDVFYLASAAQILLDIRDLYGKK
jgi:hypothetical protein